MPAIRGITISVNYAPQLAITLVRNMRHLAECLVVTSPEDECTKAVARSVPGVRVLETDAFTRHGARFNKGLAFEEGFDDMGRDGWLLVWDADILIPDCLALPELRPDVLYGCRRRMLANAVQWTPDLDWRHCPVAADGGPIGFFQLFHAQGQHVGDKRPWYDVSFAHAGGGDAYFMNLFPPSHRTLLPIEALHLGERDRNWFGTDPESQELMRAFVVRNGWSRSIRPGDHAINERVGELVERVEVPGYAPSNYELPFVRRAKDLRKQDSV
jgi:hypothetical protein